MLVLSDPVSTLWCPPALLPALEAMGAMGALAQDRAGRRGPVCLVLMGGAGMGKTSALRLLADQARAVGLEAATGADPWPAPGDGGPILRFLDDAHELEADLADRLAADATAGRVLVLAARPWPQTDAFVHLLGRLHGQSTVMLSAWEPEDVRAYLRTTGTVGVQCGPDRVARLLRLSGGLPWLVDGLAAAGPAVLPADIAGSVHARFQRLSRPAAALVEELAVGFAVDDCPVADRLDPDDFDVALAEVDAAGLLTAAGDLPPAVGAVVAEELPIHRRRRLHREVLASLPDRGSDDPERYVRVAEAGVRDDRLARGLIDVGDEMLTTCPAEATARYDLAVAAGAGPALVTARRAEVALRSADPYEAARLVDAALSTSPPTDPARTARVAFAVFGRTGIEARAAELVRLFGHTARAAEAAAACIVLLAQGQREEVEGIAARHRTDPALPTLQEEISTLVIEGLTDSLAVSPGDALPRLARAARVAATACDEAMVPMHPAVLGAVAALHGGDPALAASTIERARRAVGPDSPWYRMFALVSAWIRLATGDLAGAVRDKDEAGRGVWPPTGREAYWEAALTVGLARRGDEPTALARAWQGTSTELVTHPVDLYDLLPLGELHLAGVRLKDEAAVAAQLRTAWDLLDLLGAPALWETSLRWAAVQGAILANRPQDITPHAQALVRHAATFPPAATLASAGRVWVQVLGERFDVDEVILAAHRLRAVGQPWEAARLLGHAAAHAESRKDSSRLLESARSLGDGSSPDRSGSGVAAVRLPLSEREQQVARLVVAGHTYKEVGGRLYLSERTVEHHIARIRQRLGAGSRAELLEQLRTLLGEEGRRPSPPPPGSGFSTGPH